MTGVSRRAGIGFAIAEWLLADGASIVTQSWSADDEQQPRGACSIQAIIEELGGIGPRLRHIEADFADPQARAAGDRLCRP